MISTCEVAAGRAPVLSETKVRVQNTPWRKKTKKRQGWTMESLCGKRRRNGTFWDLLQRVEGRGR